MNSSNTNITKEPSLKVHVHSQYWIFRDKERRRERMRANLAAKSGR
jgi:hypothetical protein